MPVPSSSWAENATGTRPAFPNGACPAKATRTFRVTLFPFLTASSASSDTLPWSVPPSRITTLSSAPSPPGATEAASQVLLPGSWYSTVRSAARRSPCRFLNFRRGNATKSWAEGLLIV